MVKVLNDDTALTLVSDADDLRRAANVLARRSERPGFWLGVLLRILRDTADKLVRMAEDRTR